ncbi:MAG: hypothetical protein USCAAHI_00166 [Beijerinckiaceae bacterium]|jgi:hypothetical protein|nr:MAG: hypothetical protein USCAAHI_00166 [Beijerinckiaceae bacterium]
MTSIDDLFKGRHFDREIIILGCVGISGSNSVFGISWK